VPLLWKFAFLVLFFLDNQSIINFGNNNNVVGKGKIITSTDFELLKKDMEILKLKMERLEKREK
jgi:hypothetical protein